MKFILQELHKIVDALKEYGYEFTYVGDSAYLKLPNVKIRVDIIYINSIDNYNAISLVAMRNDSGKIDTKWVTFEDICGVLPPDRQNEHFSSGVSPHIWAGGGKTSWYVASPKSNHYKMFSDTVLNYIKVFE